MSSTLSCSFRLETTHDAAYWWPLVFEAMRRIGFGFSNPYYIPKQQGRYISWNTTIDDVTVGDSVTFLEAWRAAYRQEGSLLMEFWCLPLERFSLRLGLDRPDQGHIGFDFAIPVESLVWQDQDTMQGASVRERLEIWLQGISQFYALVGPFVADIEWERWGDIYSVGTVDKPFIPMDAQTFPVAQSLSKKPSVTTRHLETGAVLHLRTPFPIPFKGGWDHLQLQS